MSLKKKLAARPRPSSTYSLRMVDDGEAQKKLGEANARYGRALIKGDETELAAAKERRDLAQAEVDACYETLTLVALPPAEMERLINEHPPPKNDKDAAWDIKTFRPALLAATVEGDMTAEDWEELRESGNLSLGEMRDLFYACIAVNDRSPSSNPGKG